MGKKLTVYLLTGNEFGPRIVEIGNWVGKAIYCPRFSILELMTTRNEFNNPGIYFLKSNSSESAISERIYIGEAENIGKRVKQHLADSSKEFNEIVFFVSKDELLTKSQIKYLEYRLVQIAINSKSSDIENSNHPTCPKLHEADISDMEYFIEQIKLVLPLFGFYLLRPTTISNQKGDIKTVDKRLQFQIKSPSFDAQMIVTHDGFIIKKGSQANKQISASLSANYKELRQKLIDKCILIDKGKYYVFSENAIFTSSSAAANMVLGRQSPGPIEWINSENKTYKEISDEISRKIKT